MLNMNVKIKPVRHNDATGHQRTMSWMSSQVKALAFRLFGVYHPWLTSWSLYNKLMMTSSNGNIFRVTGPLCGEFTGHGEFPAQRPVTRSFDVFFNLRLNKRLSKQPPGWWFETPLWSLWRQCNIKWFEFKCENFLSRKYIKYIVWIMSVILFRSQYINSYRKISNIRRTKSPTLNVSRLVTQLSLPNSMQPGVKSRMKM